MAYLKRFIAFALGSGALVFLNLVVSGAVIASVHELRYWAYPALFGFNMFLIWLVFVLLPPPNHPEHFLIRRFPRLKKLFIVDQARMEKKLWRWARSKGAYPLIQLISFFIGPTYAAITIRLVLLFPDRKAWTYAFLTTMVSTFVLVSFYLGLIDIVKGHLLSIASH